MVQPSPADDRAVGERDIGAEIHVGGGVEPRGFADMQRPRRPVRAFGVHRGAGRRLDLGHGRRMVAMGVGDEDVGDGLAAHRVEQRGDMGVVVGAGIEDRDFAAADDVAHRALEGERARIVGDDGAHARRHLGGAGPARDRSLVVADVVAHSGTSQVGRFAGTGGGASDRRQARRGLHVQRTAGKRNSGDAAAGIDAAGRKRTAPTPKKDGAPVPGSPGLQAISFNTSCEIEIAHRIMQAAGQVGLGPV